MEKLNGIKCSTSHLSKADADIFNECMRREGDWIHDIYYGYLLLLCGYKYPCLKLKELGISKSVRKLVYSLMKAQGVAVLIFDRYADTLDGYDIYEW